MMSRVGRSGLYLLEEFARRANGCDLYCAMGDTPGHGEGETLSASTPPSSTPHAGSSSSLLSAGIDREVQHVPVWFGK